LAGTRFLLDASSIALDETIVAYTSWIAMLFWVHHVLALCVIGGGMAAGPDASAQIIIAHVHVATAGHRGGAYKGRGGQARGGGSEAGCAAFCLE